MSNERPLEAQMSADALYREDIFTDQRVGTIRRMTPVKSDGSDDPSRPLIFVGQATVMTPMGSLPLSFELPATNAGRGRDAVRAGRPARHRGRRARAAGAAPPGVVVHRHPGGGAASLKGMGGKGGIQIP